MSLPKVLWRSDAIQQSEKTRASATVLHVCCGMVECLALVYRPWQQEEEGCRRLLFPKKFRRTRHLGVPNKDFLDSRSVRYYS